MKTLLTAALSLILIQTFFSCNIKPKENEQLKSINVGANLKRQEIITLSGFAKNIRYVPLETFENMNFVGIWDCEFYHELILAKDLSKCILYRSNGKVMTKVGNKGRGPGEYSYVNNVNFGPEGIIFMQSGFDLLEYDYSGNFIRKHGNTFYKNGMYFISSWFVINDSLFLGHIPNMTGHIDSKALLVNKNGDILSYFKNYILFHREKPVSSYSEDQASFYKFENEVYYNDQYNDTLFSLNSRYDLVPRYNFTLGRFKEPISERAKLDGSDKSKYIYIRNIFQTSDYLFLKCNFCLNFPAKRLTPKPSPIDGFPPILYNTSFALGIYNKHTGDLVFSKPTSTDNPLFTTGLYNDIDNGPRFLPQKQINDSTMVMWIESKQLKEHVASDDFKNGIPKYPEKKKELEILANSLSEFDNPVFMFVTFKK
jgi:hypothetical protein